MVFCHDEAGDSQPTDLLYNLVSFLRGKGTKIGKFRISDDLNSKRLDETGISRKGQSYFLNLRKPDPFFQPSCPCDESKPQIVFTITIQIFSRDPSH